MTLYAQSLDPRVIIMYITTSGGWKLFKICLILDQPFVSLDV